MSRKASPITFIGKGDQWQSLTGLSGCSLDIRVCVGGIGVRKLRPVGRGYEAWYRSCRSLVGKGRAMSSTSRFGDHLNRSEDGRRRSRGGDKVEEWRMALESIDAIRMKLKEQRGCM
jgi:hypothetical protein